MARMPWHRRIGLEWKLRKLAGGIIVQADVYKWVEVPGEGYSKAKRIATAPTLKEALAKARRKLKIED